MKNKHKIIIILTIMTITLSSLSLPSQSLFAMGASEVELDPLSWGNRGLEDNLLDNPMSGLASPSKLEESSSEEIDEPKDEHLIEEEHSVAQPRIELEEVELEVEKPIVDENSVASIEVNESNNRVAEENWFVFNPLINSITGYSASPEAPRNITVPRQINGVDVLYIADNAFSGRQLTELILPEGLLKIGNNAFMNNNALAGNVTIPSTVIDLGEGAFSGCQSLVSVTVLANINIIKKSTFNGCSKLSSISLSNTVATIDAYAFQKCTSLTTITLPDIIRFISSTAFTECLNLSYIDVTGKSKNSIGGAPWGCSDIYAPQWKNARRIGDFYFDATNRSIGKYYGEAAESITIPSSVVIDGVSYSTKVINNEAFISNSKMKSVILPSGITSVGLKAFYNCYNLKSITIPNTVTYIGESAFEKCSRLASVTIPGSVSEIKAKTFKECGRLADVTILAGVTIISEEAFAYCSDLTSITIANTVTSIGDYAFRNCLSLPSIIIPNSVISIEQSVFFSCQSLEVISIPTKSTGGIAGAPWGALGRVLIAWMDVVVIGDYAYRITDKAIVKYFGSEENVIIPTNFTVNGTVHPVNIITNAAFSSSRSLVSVVIPEGVVSIGEEVFYSCRELVSVTLPSTLTSVGSGAFTGCDKLSTISLPDGLRYIGSSAFSSCREFTSINMGNNVISIGEYAFSGCSKLVNIKIPSSVESIGSSAFRSIGATAIIDITTKDKGSIAGESWGAPPRAAILWSGDSIQGDYVFRKAENMIVKYIGLGGELTLPGSFNIEGITYPVKAIGKEAFYRHTGLTSLTVHEGVLNIGEKAFAECSSLVSITLPNSVTALGNDAFNKCSNLLSITIPNGVTSIGRATFYNCLSLTSVIIPNSVISIGDLAFYGNENLEYIAIPSSVTSIASYSFERCYKLKIIDITSKPKGSIPVGAWGKGSVTTVLWDEVRIVGDFIFDRTTNTIVKYLGNDTRVKVPSEIHMNEENYTVKIIGSLCFWNSTITEVSLPNTIKKLESSVFSGCKYLVSIIIPESVTDIAGGIFVGCSSLLTVTIPDSVTELYSSIFQDCTSLETVTLSANITNIYGNILYNTPNLKAIYVRRTRESIPNVVASQPWGAGNNVKVFYSGDSPNFVHKVVPIPGQFAQNINISAYLNSPAQIRLITLPDGTTINITSSTWPETGVYTYRVTSNGTYIFKGEDISGNIVDYPVVIDNIGAITVHAYSGTLNENIAQVMTKQDILNYVGARAVDELGELPANTLDISNSDLAKINALTDGHSETIRVIATSNRSGAIMTNYRDVTLIGSSCTIDISNNNLWRTQALSITKEQLKTALGATVSFSDNTVVNMSKLSISDADLALINTATVGTCSIWLTYDNGIGRRLFEINILDEAPSVLIQIPESIEMQRVEETGIFVADAVGEVSLLPFPNMDYFQGNFFVRTDPYYTLTNQESGETFRVQVYDENDVMYTDSGTNLAMLSVTGNMHKEFKLKAFQKPGNGPGIYRGIMNFYLSYGGDGS